VVLGAEERLIRTGAPASGAKNIELIEAAR
jgi:hypothetical protein